MKINEKNLCVFATSPPFDCDGFLNKRGEVNKAFQRRFFVLKGNLLFYFEKKGDKEPLGLIIVEGCTIELSDESDQYCFEIAFNGNRSYVLSADSQDSMETWMKALTCAGYEYKKLMVAELQRQLEEIEGSRNKMLGVETSNTLVSAPRPPPRRQNPFNRPAPPLPTLNGSNSASTNNITPFINGHFGSTAHRSSNAIHAHSGVGINNSIPVPPPRGISTTSGKSEFYQQIPQQQNQTSAEIATVFHSLSSEGDFRNHNNHNITPVVVSFEQFHEIFRPLVMKDVLEYRLARELKTRPLIEL